MKKGIVGKKIGNRVLTLLDRVNAPLFDRIHTEKPIARRHKRIGIPFDHTKLRTDAPCEKVVEVAVFFLFI